MAEDGKFVIEKFDGSDFSWWKMQMDALLCQKDLDVVLEEKPEKMDKAEEALWDAKDKKARGVITLALTRSVAFNIMSETTARGMMLALSNMYEKPSAANKVFLMRELFTMRMKEGSSVTEHINNLNSILSRLSSVGMKFDDETKAVLLLSSLPDSWSGTVTAVTSSVGTSGMTFEGIRDLVLGEDVRRRSAKGGSSSDLLHVGRGRDNSRNSGSSKGQGRSSSRARPSVRCWDCNEKGHFRNRCPNKKSEKELNTTAAVGNYSDDEALLLSVESSVDSWVMDSGASFHATHSSDGMRNLKEGDFGKVRLGNGEILDVTGMGDLDLRTPLGTTWTLYNVRVVPRLETKLISVGQLDEQGLDVKFGSGKWRVIKDNLVIARGFKKGSLYMVPVPSGEVTTPVKTNARVGLVDSRAKRVQFVAKNSGAPGNQLERIRRSEHGRDFRNSGSTGCVLTQSGKRRWVRKTRKPNEISPGKLLQLESVPLGIPRSDVGTRLWESVGIEDASLRTGSAKTVLEPSGASTGPSVY